MPGTNIPHLWADPAAVATLREAYRISGNTAALNALPAREPARDPVYDVQREWQKQHPSPGQNASREDTRTYYRALADAQRIPLEEETLSSVLHQRAYKSDPIHPNAEGYRLLAQALADLLRHSGAV